MHVYQIVYQQSTKSRLLRLYELDIYPVIPM